MREVRVTLYAARLYYFHLEFVKLFDEDLNVFTGFLVKIFCR